MAFFSWNDRYLLGVNEIDQQHRHLLQNINRLHEAMLAGKAKNLLAELLQDLLAYTRFHFETEERYFSQSQYPNAVLHKLEHRNFTRHIQDFKSEFERGNTAITIRLLSFLKEWVHNHILEQDVQFGAYFRKQCA